MSGAIQAAGPGHGAAGPEHVVRGQAALLVSSVGQLGISVLTVAVVGRWLSPAAFALFGLIGAIFSMARDLLDLGSTGVATRLLAREPRRARAILGAVMAWRGGLAIVGMLLVVLAAGTLGPPEERPIVVAAGLALVSSVSGAFNALFNARHRQLAPALASIAVQGGALVVLVLLRERGASGESAAWVLIGREVLWWAVIAALGLRLLGGVPERPRTREAMRPVVLPGLVFGAAVLLHQVLVQGDLPLTRWGMNQAAAALVAASSRPIGAMVALPWIAAAPLIAAVTALRAKDQVLASRLVSSACVLGLCVGILVAVLGAMSGREILVVLYRDKYAADPAGVVVCRAYCAVLGAAIAAAAPTMTLVAMHRERALLGVCGVSVLLAAGVKVIGVQRGDVGMIGMTTAVAEWAIAAAVMVLAVRAPWRRHHRAMVAGIVLFAGAGGVVLWFAGMAPAWHLLVAVGCGALGLVVVTRSRAATEYRDMCRLAGAEGDGAP